MTADKLGEAYLEIILRGLDKIKKDLRDLEKDTKETAERTEKIAKDSGNKILAFKKAMNQQQLRETQKTDNQILAFKKAMNQQQLREVEKTEKDIDRVRSASMTSHEKNIKNANRVQSENVAITKRLVSEGALSSNEGQKLIQKQTNVTKDKIKNLNTELKKSKSSFADTTMGVLKAAPAFAVATAAISSVYIAIRTLTNGFVFGLKAVEDFKIKTASMAAFITTFADKTQEGGDISKIYTRAKSEAENLISTLEILDAKTIATGRDLGIIAEQFIKSGIQIDINNKEVQQGFINIANATKLLTAGQNQEIQLRQEIRALASGQLRDTNILLKTLQAIDPEIKKNLEKWKDSGKTIQEIGKLLKGFAPASKDIEITWSAIGTSLQTTASRVLRGAMLPIYNDLLDLAQKLKDVYIDQNGQLTEQATILQEKIQRAWEKIKSTSEKVVSFFDIWGKSIINITKLLVLAKGAQIAFNMATKRNVYIAGGMALVGVATWLKGHIDSLNDAKKAQDDLNKSTAAFALLPVAPGMTSSFNQTAQRSSTPSGDPQFMAAVALENAGYNQLVTARDLESKTATLLKLNLDVAEAIEKQNKELGISAEIYTSASQKIKDIRQNFEDARKSIADIFEEKIQSGIEFGLDEKQMQQLKSDFAERIRQLNISETIQLQPLLISAPTAPTDVGIGNLAPQSGMDAALERANEMIETQESLREIIQTGMTEEQKGIENIVFGYGQQIALLKEKGLIAGLTQEEIDKLIAKLKGLIAVAEDTSWQNAVRDGLKKYADDSGDSFKTLSDIALNVTKGIEDAFVEMAETGKLSFKDMVNSMLADLYRLAIQQSITNPIAEGLSSINLGSFFGASGSGSMSTPVTPTYNPSASQTMFAANGAGFVDGVQKFANGGAFTNSIVSKPTVFPFANGVGLMGEAGPEAIMPLERNSKGQLGVVASGGASTSPNVTVNVINNGQEQKQAKTDVKLDIKGMIIDVFIEDYSQNGPTRQIMSGGV